MSLRLCIFVIFVVLCCLAAGEYHIINDHKLSYLYNKFDNLKESVFPREIRLNVSLSRSVGTLLYSIDRHMNQLIINIYDAVPPTLSVEFNKQTKILSLSELCGCDRCMYEILDLRVQIIDRSIYISCNDRENKKINIGKEMQLNTDYPIMFSPVNSSIGSSNEAHLFILNVPSIYNTRSNSHQTYGCIFSVKYNNREVSFSNFTYNIKLKCIPTCVGDVCNGGKCYENYNDAPICNCTTTFLNGQFCNDTINSMNLFTKSRLYVFDIIKLSWKNTTTDELVRLRNKNVNIILASSGRNLTLLYEYLNGHNTQFKVALSNSYNPNQENICILYFYETFVNIKIINNDGSWDEILMSTLRDLRREIFDSVTLRSGDGVIDFLYKYHAEYKFRKMQITDYSSIPFENKRIKKNITNVTFKVAHQDSKTIWICVVVVSIILTVGLAIWLFISKRRKPRRRVPKYRKPEAGTENNIPLDPPGVEKNKSETNLSNSYRRRRSRPNSSLSNKTSDSGCGPEDIRKGSSGARTVDLDFETNPLIVVHR